MYDQYLDQRSSTGKDESLSMNWFAFLFSFFIDWSDSLENISPIETITSTHLQIFYYFFHFQTEFQMIIIDCVQCMTTIINNQYSI